MCPRSQQRGTGERSEDASHVRWWPGTVQGPRVSLQGQVPPLTGWAPLLCTWPGLAQPLQASGRPQWASWQPVTLQDQATDKDGQERERRPGQGLQSRRRRNNSGSKQRSHPSNGPRCRRGTCGHVPTCVCVSRLNTCPDSPHMRQADSPGLLTSDGLQSPM